MIVIGLACFVALLWLSSPPASATVPGYFTQLDYDCGGYVTGFAVHPSGRIYCRANVGGIYRSDDHGETWQWLSGEMKTPAGQTPWAIAVAPSNPDIVYQSVGTSYMASDPGRGVWKSTDGGATWTQVLAGVNMAGNDEVMYGGPALILNPSDENEVWTTSRANGLYRSLDAGAHWSRMGGTLFDSFIGACFCIHPKFPNQIWLGGEGGVYVSVDRGTTWTLVRACTRAYRIARFNDGTTFVVGLDSKGASFLWAISATDWSNPATYVVTDKSAQFSDVYAFDTMSLLAIGADDTTVWAGSRMTTKVSYDRGATWTKPAMAVQMSGYWPIWQRPDDTVVGWGRSEMAQDPLDPKRWYVAGGNTPNVTEDDGATWKNLSRGLAETCMGKPTFHPTNPDIVFVPAGDQYGMVITDGGRSGYASHCLYALTPGHIVASGWKFLVSGDKAVALYKRYGDNGARLAVSTGDYGQWTEVTPTGIPLGVFCDGVMSPDNADDFLVLNVGTTGPGAAGTYRTTDGGRSFTQCAGIPAGVFTGGNYSYFGYNDLQTDPVAASVRYFLLQGSGFYRSEDRGATWKAVSSTLPAGFGAIAQDPAKGGRLWAAIAGAGLYRTDDGGDHWTHIGDFAFTTPRLDACGGRIVVFGMRPGDTWNKIYYSADDGDTWDEITRPGLRFPTVDGLACDPHHADKIWISTAGRSSSVFTITRDARAQDLAITTNNWEGRRVSGGTDLGAWIPDQSGVDGTKIVSASAATWTMLRPMAVFDRGTSLHLDVNVSQALADSADGAVLGFSDGWAGLGRLTGVQISGGQLFLYDSAAGGRIRSLGAWSAGTWSTLGLAVDFQGGLVVSRSGVADVSYVPATALPSSLRLVVTAAGGSADGLTLRAVTSSTLPALNHFVDVSTRCFVGQGASVGVAGFVLAKTSLVLIRAGGPSLAAYGVADALRMPLLTLFNGSGQAILSNQDWRTAPRYLNGTAPLPDGTYGTDYDLAQVAAAVGAYPYGATPDSALVVKLPPGVYTAQVEGADGGTGNAIVEAYLYRPAGDTTQGDRFTAISTRCFVGSGDSVAIVGIAVERRSKVLLRAVGPSLAHFGVSGVLAHPSISLVDANGTLVQSNAGWKSDPFAAGAIQQATAAANDFPLTDPNDAVLMVDLPAGLYSALVKGVDGGTGNAIVEAYLLPGSD